MNLREVAKNEYRTVDTDPTYKEIQTGCLQRIADATEAMAKGHVALQNDRDWYKKAYQDQAKEEEHLCRVIRSLRGVITRMKK